MGYVEYKEGKLDTCGNKLWYYRFLDDNKEDLTEEFAFIGRKTRVKGVRYILSRTEPGVLFRAFQQQIEFSFYSIPSLGEAQRDIDRCNSKRGCSYYCGNSRMQSCSKLRKHNEAAALNSRVKSIVDSPMSNWYKI